MSLREIGVSIHAPARGATQIQVLEADHLDVSIHAPARGATSSTTGSTWGASCFNPRARTGRDLRLDTLEAAHACFNPRARTGRDRR